MATALSCAGWLGPAVATGWSAACTFDVLAGGIGRRALAGPVGFGETEGRMAEAAALADAISAGSVERSVFCASCTSVAAALS
jgi:hypothetical protein